MNLDFKNLSQWLNAKKLSLNVMNRIIFHLNSKRTDHSLKVKLYRNRSTQTDTVNYLGVLLKGHLLWSKQINHLATKLNQTIGILS